ncbi:MAG TPA: hypothetical protein VM659_16685 [Dongiaceae bacterium]|nr:hypothetical protein [Dongiaceae bacterium]
MSVISPNDATEGLTDTPASLSSHDGALKPGQLLVEISPTAFTETAMAATESIGEAVLDVHHQATIALNVSDVLDLGTENIDGRDALVINGEQGDSVHLASEPGYIWSRASAEAPTGYQMFHAHTVTGDPQGAILAADAHHQPITVLVQQDLTVILHTS